ncbi:MAG: PTS sugar transporter subunit IIC [Desulfovibrionaceae bacterium]|nr:PTS sugar transporter subunit IIC [Desulfovibrionaceae bacterium]MBF0514667.1 PTS sugar transporter subunit IIC [Desulfovibrionaceae bacterium]
MHQRAALGNSRHEFFFALFSLLRFSASLGLIERPIVQALIFGALTGETTLALQIAIFFELFWLDLFPAGTYLPPNAAASNLASLFLVRVSALHDPGQIAAVMLLTLPLARIFGKLETSQRVLANSFYNRLLKWSRQGPGKMRPGRLILESMTVQFALNAIGFALALGALLALLSLVSGKLFAAFQGLGVGFAHMWILGSLGAVLSLRYRPAQTTLAAGAALLALAAMFS